MVGAVKREREGESLFFLQTTKVGIEDSVKNEIIRR